MDVLFTMSRPLNIKRLEGFVPPLRSRYKLTPLPPKPLPRSLSWNSSLAIVLPESHPLHPRIDTLKKAYDMRNYLKFPMPHFKLIYPFLVLSPEGRISFPICSRIQRALSPLEPFTIRLTPPLRSFKPPQSEEYPDPKPSFAILPSVNSLPSLNNLQSTLNSEFRPELACAGDMLEFGVAKPNFSTPQKPQQAMTKWEPYLSLGMDSHSTDDNAVKERFERGVWGIEGLRAESEREAKKFGWNWDNRIEDARRKELEGKGANKGRVAELWNNTETKELDWVVGKVSVLWSPRKGYPFQVIKEIPLGRNN